MVVDMDTPSTSTVPPVPAEMVSRVWNTGLDVPVGAAALRLCACHSVVKTTS
jgi:hypothetical protein